ncbi:phage holin family protein [Salmonella enterica subsp. enterica serovar Infantis]|nr:phage holin family protein [Salmonella enterica subsp. enterica serovar Infantis]EGI5923906.1 phage holin family protein [Salmonella enterica subsp. enterica serovar Colindale]
MNVILMPTAINIVACTLIIIRVIIWRRNGHRYKPGISVLAWLLAVSCFLIVFSLLLGYYRLTDWAETLINCLFCISINLSSGNLSHFLRTKG